MVNPVLIQEQVGGLEQLLDIRAPGSRSSDGSWMRWVEAGRVLGDGVPDIAARARCTRRRRWARSGASGSRGSARGMPRRWSGDRSPRGAAGCGAGRCARRMRQRCQSAARQTGGAVDIRAHGHTLAAHLGHGVQIGLGPGGAGARAGSSGSWSASSGIAWRSPAISPWLRIGETTPPRRAMRSSWSPRLPASCATLCTSLVP